MLRVGDLVLDMFGHIGIVLWLEVVGPRVLVYDNFSGHFTACYDNIQSTKIIRRCHDDD